LKTQVFWDFVPYQLVNSSYPAFHRIMMLSF